jgi:predicted RNase H-like HicB family nuclease
MSELEKYLKLPYTVLLRRDIEDDFVARIEELPGCSAHGKTREEALENLDEAKALWVQDCLENGDQVPLPAADEPLPSGKWLQRVPRRLHRKLQLFAKKEGVSFNQCISAILAEAVGEQLADRLEQIPSHVQEVLTTNWAGYFGRKDYESRPPDFRFFNVTSENRQFSELAIARILAILSSQVPDRIEFKSKVKKDAKKKHTSLEVC